MLLPQARRLLTLGFATIATSVAACGTVAPSAPEATVGPEALQLGLTASTTELGPLDQLSVRMYATNPSLYPVARVDCFHYGLGLVLRSSSGAVEDVFPFIPPCKVPICRLRSGWPRGRRIPLGSNGVALRGVIPQGNTISKSSTGASTASLPGLQSRSASSRPEAGAPILCLPVADT